MKNYLTILAFVLVLTGCVTAPTGFKEQLAAAEATHNAVIDATDSSLNAGTLTSVAAQSIAAQADDAQKVLEAAKDAYLAGNAGEAQNKLVTALTALTALQNYLRSQGAQK